MPFDPDDRESVNQFSIRARNEGHSDEEIIDFIKKQRVSTAGKTLQRESAFKLQQSKPIMSAGAADVLPPGNYQEVLPYILGAPGQAMKEGLDKLQAMGEGTPGPSLGGAAARVGAMIIAPKIFEGGVKLLGRSVGFVGPAMERVAQSGPVQAAKTLWGKLGAGAEEQVGTEIATTTGRALKGMQPTAVAKDAFVDNLNQQGSKIKVMGFADKMKNIISEAETYGSDALKQARGRLHEMADELISKHQEGAVGLGDFMTFKENLSKQLFRATNSTLRFKLGALAQEADDILIQELGPGAANHIKSLEIATANRLGALRKVNKMFRLHPEAVIRKAAGSEEIMRAVNELDGQMGTKFADAIQELATKKSFSPKEMPVAYKLIDRMTRIAGSSAVGLSAGGPAGFLAYLATSPPMRRQMAKFGLLLSTTAAPEAATAAIANETSK